MIQLFNIINFGDYITCYAILDGDESRTYYFKISLEGEFAHTLETDLPENEFIWRRQVETAVTNRLKGQDPMPDHITSFWY